jgi:ribonucleotide reductase beta subunit family protein with ferritin-like domain
VVTVARTKEKIMKYAEITRCAGRDNICHVVSIVNTIEQVKRTECGLTTRFVAVDDTFDDDWIWGDVAAMMKTVD